MPKIDQLVEELIQNKLEARKFYLRQKVIASVTGFPITIVDENGVDKMVAP